VRSLQHTTPSHLADRQLFDFAGLQADQPSQLGIPVTEVFAD